MPNSCQCQFKNVFSGGSGVVHLVTHVLEHQHTLSSDCFSSFLYSLVFPAFLEGGRGSSALCFHGTIKIKESKFTTEVTGAQDELWPSVLPDLTTKIWLELEQCIRGIYGLDAESTFRLFHSLGPHSY